MIIIPPVKYRKRRRIRNERAQPAAEPPVLVAVDYNEGTWVRLTFDRTIDVAQLVTADLYVYDASWGLQNYRGTGSGTLLDPQTVEIALANDGPTSGSGIRMTATSGIGITSTDGAAWAGVSDVEIPFG